MTAAFPEIVQALYQVLPARTVLDGEIVCWADGRLDFTALQHRHTARGARGAELARAMPCHFIAFDVPRADGRDLAGEPLSTRRAELEQLLADVPSTSPVTLGLHTADVDEARSWFDAIAPLGVEGLVVKAAGERYRPGARSWQKVKHFTTTEFVVGGVTGTLRRLRWSRIRPSRPGSRRTVVWLRSPDGAAQQGRSWPRDPCRRRRGGRPGRRGGAGRCQ